MQGVQALCLPAGDGPGGDGTAGLRGIVMHLHALHAEALDTPHCAAMTVDQSVRPVTSCSAAVSARVRGSMSSVP